MECLKGKTAIITGASSGIGKATALQLAKAGCNVVLVARRREKLAMLSDFIIDDGGSCEFVCADITREEDVKRVFSETERLFGSVDLLINNAGRGLKAELDEISLDEWNSTLAVNATGAFLCTRECVKAMRRLGTADGKIVTVSSVVGLFPAPGYSAYCASKHCVTGFMRSVYFEAKKYGIKTASIYPARINTEFFDLHGYSERPSSGQMLSPVHVARHIVALCSGSRSRIAAAVLANIFHRIAGYFTLLASK